MCNELIIFVEGSDDEVFFDKIVRSMFGKRYGSVRVQTYAARTKEYIRNFLKSINSKNWNADYIFVADINDAPCVTAKKQEIEDKFKGIDTNKIIVVKKEIESWYLALLDDNTCSKLGIPSYNTTDNITKEEFDRLIPKKFGGSRLSFMLEVITRASIDVAKQKNASFGYFISKYNLR